MWERGIPHEKYTVQAPEQPHDRLPAHGQAREALAVCLLGPAPKSSLLPGRVHVIHGDAHPAQAVLMTDAEAIVWVTATAAGETEAG